MELPLSIYRSACILILSALVLFLFALVCLAGTSDIKIHSNGAHKTLRLIAKHPGTWAVVKGGRGAISYRESTGDFTLNAEGLHFRARYALIRYADTPPRAEILARGMSDERGRLKLTGVWRNWTRKFWLVSGEDVIGKVGEVGSLRAWRPDRYLFEEKLLGVGSE
jgi:hypothetical protein